MCLLPENKMRWWMKSEDKEGKDAFVRIPRDAIGNDPLDEELDLTPGRYSAGCGEWSVASTDGKRKVYQRMYFYVTTDGQVVYVNRKDELPELHDIIDGNVAGAPPEERGILESYGNTSNASKGYQMLSGILYCNRNKDDEGGDSLIERIMMSGDACEEYVEDTPGADFGCGNCIFSKQVYRIN